MNLYVRLSTKEITTRQGVGSPFVSFKRGEGYDEVRVVFLDDSNRTIPMPIPAGKQLFLTFGIRQLGDYTGSLLVRASSYTVEGSGANTAYVLRPNFNTVELNAIFDADTTIESVRCMGELYWRLDTISPIEIGLPVKSETFDVLIVKDVISDEDAPTEISGNASLSAALAERLIFRSALTGGTATSLDGVATTTLAVMTPCLVSQAGVLSMWQLQVWDGTTAEDTAAGLVLPDDAVPVTNAKIWVRLS